MGWRKLESFTFKVNVVGNACLIVISRLSTKHLGPIETEMGHTFTSFCNYSVLPSLNKVYYYYGEFTS